jgi:RNA polymerase sigma factor (sigma-70 family)
MAMGNDTAPASGGFPATQWTLVGDAALPPGNTAKPQALAKLLERYLPALVQHLMFRFRVDRADADDLVQEFIASRVLEKNILTSADRSRGRFRSFLCASLDRHAMNRLRYQKARKRSPLRAISLDADNAPPVSQAQPAVDRSFDLAWARQVIDQCLRRMRSECEMSQRADIWEIFDCRIRGPILEHAEPVPYEQLTSRLGLVSPIQAANLLITTKRMFQRVLRDVVTEYADSPTCVDEEIVDLFNTLSSQRA